MAIQIPPPSEHALTHHGDNAWSVTRRLQRADPNDADTWRGTGPDGRYYTIKQLPGGEAWDVSIDSIDGGNITRFTCKSRNWVARKLLWCSMSIVFICAALLCSGVITL